MYTTGSIGSRHESEAFGEIYELSNKSTYNETSASISDANYYDAIGRTLSNGLISAISLSGDQFFYANPLESDGEYKFDFGVSTRQLWFDCSR